jgi:voltage-gated potassium channel
MSILQQHIAQDSTLYYVDEYGVKNYKTRAILGVGILAMALLIIGLGTGLYIAEQGNPEANIKTLANAYWVMVMSSTTIGFGDFYPTTNWGYICVSLMFIFGVGIMGGIGAVVASKIFGFSDTNVKNRELKQQNAEILKKLTAIEKKLSQD